jgi:glycerol-3-phosphate cytidylyltransferase-like family protein
MSELDRKEIIESLACVDKVVISGHKKGTKDLSVCTELRKIKPHVFANGGDRFADNIPEFKVCSELGIEMVFNIGKGGKVRSSSELLQKYAKVHHKKLKKLKPWKIKTKK